LLTPICVDVGVFARLMKTTCLWRGWRGVFLQGVLKGVVCGLFSNLGGMLVE